MPEKAIGSPAEGAARATAGIESSNKPVADKPAAPVEVAMADDGATREDGVTNPRDGRGPLRRGDDETVKLPLRPPH
jgi:hypothetical protein